MLCQPARISEAVADAIADKYGTITNLMEAYLREQNPGRARLLLADLAVGPFNHYLCFFWILTDYGFRKNEIRTGGPQMGQLGRRFREEFMSSSGSTIRSHYSTAGNPNIFFFDIHRSGLMAVMRLFFMAL